jgi:hypothetical protein
MPNESIDYIIEPSNKTSYYYKNGEKIEITTCNVTVKSESVLQNLPEEVNAKIPPTSWAFTPAAKKVWQKNFDGEWEPTE